MFATDRDLLVFEPMLFVDVRWESQVRMGGRCSVDATVLALEDFDSDFEQAQVGPGHVVMVGRLALEVLSRQHAKKVEVSRLRAGRADAAIGVGKRSDACYVMTFAPQLAVVAGHMLGLAGLTEQEGSRVMNVDACVGVQVAGVLAMIFAAAGSSLDHDHPHMQRAAWYQSRYERACERLTLVLDVDGDGVADCSRRLAGGQLVRGA